MRSNVIKGMAFFLAGLMIMQVVATGGSKKAAADHSDNAKIVSLPSVMTMYTANYGQVDSSAPSPFNASVPYGICAGAIQDATKSTYEICYCIDYAKLAEVSDSLSSKTQDAGNLLTNEQAMLINTTFLLGFNKQNLTPSALTSADKNAYFATQVLIWIIKEGYFNDNTKRTATENFFFKQMPSIKSDYQTLYNKVRAQLTTPSFVNTTENVMKYNATTKKYELTLTNSTQGAMNTLKADTSSLPTGVTATVNGETLVLSSENAVTTPFKVKLTKAVNAKGKLIAWKNTSGDKQPQVSLDYDLDPIAQTMEITCKTEAAVAPPTTATVAPTNTPVASDPSKEVTTGDSNTYETKELVNNANQMDNSPKTADESSITLAYKLIGASLFTMISLYIVSIINKRKQRF